METGGFCALLWISCKLEVFTDSGGFRKEGVLCLTEIMLFYGHRRMLFTGLSGILADFDGILRRRSILWRLAELGTTSEFSVEKSVGL
jgi:hypothetical protein